MTRSADSAGLESMPNGAASRQRWRELEAGLSYFMVMLTIGWVLGPIREFAMRGGTDPLLAILCQAVATLLGLVWAAGWVVEAFDVRDRTLDRLAIGFGAVALLLACDMAGSYLMYGVGPLEFAEVFLGPPGAAVAVSLLIAAVLPALRHRGRES